MEAEYKASQEQTKRLLDQVGAGFISMGMPNVPMNKINPTWLEVKSNRDVSSAQTKAGDTKSTLIDSVKSLAKKVIKIKDGLDESV